MDRLKNLSDTPEGADMFGSIADAHSHLHECSDVASVIEDCRRVGIIRAVVNGTHPGDWPAVERLARQHPDFVVPSFGLHPWHCQDAPTDWLEQMTGWIDRIPGARIGECGLDGCPGRPAMADQIAVFRKQWNLATGRGLAVSIHCVRATQPLLDVLRSSPSSQGFLLHGFLGPLAILPELTRLGAYFSLSARLLRSPNIAAWVQALPIDRIVMESDAPHGPPSGHLQTHSLDGRHHPANLAATTRQFQQLRGCADFPKHCMENFLRLFSSP